MKPQFALDLHMHTNVSDGTDTPEQILARVRAAGLQLFSVTDHDDIKGCRIIREIRTEEDPRFMTGVEFSCRDEEGQYHILGYHYDPDAPSVREVVQTGHGYRMEKLQERLDFLKKEFGFGFPEEELQALFAMDNPGKPHIGNLMAKYGYAASKDEAIRLYINKLKIREKYVRPEAAVRGILQAGGIPVLAHPSYGNGDQIIVGREMETRLRRLMDFGLQGVEAFYSGFTARLRDEILGYAQKYGLYVTAGSDYHGSNKLVVLGDTGLQQAGDWPEGLRRFLEDTGSREGLTYSP